MAAGLSGEYALANTLWPSTRGGHQGTSPWRCEHLPQPMERVDRAWTGGGGWPEQDGGDGAQQGKPLARAQRRKPVMGANPETRKIPIAFGQIVGEHAASLSAGCHAPAGGMSVGRIAPPMKGRAAASANRRAASAAKASTGDCHRAERMNRLSDVPQ